MTREGRKIVNQYAQLQPDLALKQGCCRSNCVWGGYDGCLEARNDFVSS